MAIGVRRKRRIPDPAILSVLAAGHGFWSSGAVFWRGHAVISNFRCDNRSMGLEDRSGEPHDHRGKVYEQVKALPEPLAREVLDFIGYLRGRQDRGAWRDLMDAQARSLAPVWDNPEDEVWDNA